MVYSFSKKDSFTRPALSQDLKKGVFLSSFANGVLKKLQSQKGKELLIFITFTELHITLQIYFLVYFFPVSNIVDTAMEAFPLLVIYLFN